MTTTAGRDLFAQVLDPASRHDPYPLYARLRETPVSLQEDGTYAVSGYPEIAALLHDPRVSSDERKSSRGTAAMSASGRFDNPPFIFRDPPDHDRLRRLVMRQFTPERIAGMHERVVAVVAGLLDAHRGHGQIDIVDNLAYPLPVTVICELLGVPREDEPRFDDWASALARSLDPPESMTKQEIQHAGHARAELREYLSGLASERRAQPRNDLISGLAASRDGTGQMSDQDLLSTLVLLLVAGHETTVNLITNGMLTLLRHPNALERLRREPDLITPWSRKSCASTHRCSSAPAQPSRTCKPPASPSRKRRPWPCCRPREAVTRVASPTPTSSPRTAPTTSTRLRRRHPLLRRRAARPHRGTHRARRAGPAPGNPASARRPAAIQGERGAARPTPPAGHLRPARRLSPSRLGVPRAGVAGEDPHCDRAAPSSP
jgi:cytochrome P450